MSDTPRTDAARFGFYVEVHFARALERQNAELLAALRGVLVWMPIYPESAECIVGGKDAYESARAKAREAIRRAEG